MDDVLKIWEKIRTLVLELMAKWGVRWWVNDLGGLCMALTAGEDLYQGECVSVIQTGGTGSADNTVMKTPSSGDELDMPLGFVAWDAAKGGTAWVCVAGLSYALPESGVTAARGNVIYSSSTAAGRQAQASGIGAAQHWRENGHWMANGSGAGAKTVCMVHQN